MHRVLYAIVVCICVVGELDEIRCDSDSKIVYDPPGNTRHPHGDEHLVNADIASLDINRAICSELQAPIPPQGKCPFPPENSSDMKFTNPYVACITFSSLHLSEKETASGETALPRMQCKSCDVKQADDTTAALLSCFRCYDVPTAGFDANLTAHDILFKVIFMEIANYTSVKVTGQENF